MNKIVNNKVFPMVALMVMLSASGAAALSWSVDFEDGFNASRGQIVLVGGDLEDPFDSGNYTYIREDPLHPDNHEVRVGRTGGDALLRYEGMDSALLGGSGTVTLDFRIDRAGYPTSLGAFFVADRDGSARDFWLIGLSKPYRVLVRTDSTAGGDDAGQFNYTADIPGGNLSVGWHEMRFTWTQTVVQDRSNDIRERADLRLYVDGALILTLDHALWTGACNRNINIGSFNNGETIFYRCGAVYVMLDNIEVTSQLPLCGAEGTTTPAGDLDQDCYVNLKDFAAFASVWLQCTDPAESGCQGFVN